MQIESDSFNESVESIRRSMFFKWNPLEKEGSMELTYNQLSKDPPTATFIEALIPGSISYTKQNYSKYSERIKSFLQTNNI